MTIKFMTGGWEEKIESVEIERETESTVWVKGRPRRKSSGLTAYWDSWDEAHTYLVRKAEKELDELNRKAERKVAELAEIKNMEAPKGCGRGSGVNTR